MAAPEPVWLSNPLPISDEKLQQALGAEWFDLVLAARRGDIARVTPDEHALNLKRWHELKDDVCAPSSAAAAANSSEPQLGERGAAAVDEQSEVRFEQPARDPDARGHAAGSDVNLYSA